MKLHAAVFLTALAHATPAAAQAVSSDVLVRYSFDDGSLETGPDSFRLFQAGKGRVSLSRVYHYSGSYAVEIEDVPGDGDFPELQGYFPRQSEGVLFVHFAFMTTDAREELNIALAGTAGFDQSKHGLAFWLRTQGGFLRHVSDSIPKKLAPVRPFVFYIVDVTYDIDHGCYDLRIVEEGNRRTVAELQDQPNVTSSPASDVAMFSFIGDRGDDTSRAHYFIDDIVVSADRAVVQAPLRAPGRRKLFIDAWHESAIASDEAMRCPQLERSADLGMDPADLRRALEAEAAVLATPNTPVNEAPGARTLRAWRRGCEALERGDAERALNAFDAAASDAAAPLLDLGRALALAKRGLLEEAEAALQRASRVSAGDPRWDITAATVSFVAGDLNRAEEALSRVTARSADADSAPAATARRYLLLLLWNGKPEAAIHQAERLVATSEASSESNAEWLELLGDARFYAGHPRQAASAYEQAYKHHSERARLDQKLADVYFRLGDLAKERRHRERVWGAFAKPSAAP